jgi:Spy/CpxP family protein refolding chaperone
MDANPGNRKAIFLVFVVFALGIALGAIGMYVVKARVLAAHPQTALRTPSSTMAMFTRDLNLDADQQAKIQAIFNDTRSHYAELHDKFDPEYERVRQEGRERIRQVLTPEQRPKLEELLRQIDEDRRRRAAAQGH